MYGIQPLLAALTIYLLMVTHLQGMTMSNLSNAFPNTVTDEQNTPKAPPLETATFGNGCFWCTEAIFQRLKGVVTVKSGYTGGKVKNPTYKQVCEGNTGHAEAIQITFDPKVITYAELLEVFWQTHDPTTLNRQGADVGTQYRSAIFYHTPEQKKLAEEYKQKLDKSGAFNKPIVTEITAASKFYVAEDYHQNYYNLNGSQPYCQAVIKPKMEKFKKVFADKLKKE
ncbi:MAG TPA: peptide-methionine (S)-S-oxide reductase MsrA [Gemmatales bacterium]|nr:peptide-methionine (S)-S-oxide reductase MsrA [Gemmatales bacterium]